MENRLVKIKDYKIIQDYFCQEENKMYEGIFAQGNGYLHLRGNFEEGLTDAPQDEIYHRMMKSVTTEVQRNPISKRGTYLPLVMGNHPFLGEVMINLPFFMDIRIGADGQKMDMMHSKIEGYSRELNMKTGELKRSFEWITKSGCRIHAMFQRFASIKNKRLFVQKVTCRILEGESRIEVHSGMDATVTTNGFQHFKKSSFTEREGKLICRVLTDLDYEVVIHTYNKLSCNRELREMQNEAGGYCQKYSEIMRQGDELELIKYTTIGCSRDLCEDFEKEARNALLDAIPCTYDQLLQDSSILWNKRWEIADIEIKGNAELANGIRFSLYHLLRCQNEEEERIQICAKGFAGEAYYGRYFWDSEIYLLPFYIYTDPKAAKNILMYRYHTLEGAKKNAEQYHCRGARYPWQSGLNGTEQCPLWEYADNEIHITSDVAFGVMHYFKATGDWEFMENYGVEILMETAQFWMDRADVDENGKYHLLNVMGPDEYSPMTKDNGFTNRMVRYNIASALQMFALLKIKNNRKYELLVNKTGIEENDLLVLEKIAGELPIPYDAKRDLYLQCTDFEEYAPIRLDDYWKDKSRAFGHFVTQEKIYRSQCIKQADTILLMNIFENEFTDAQVKTAYEYYKPLTTHDSSLSPVMHTLAANRLCRDGDTREFLDKALSVDLSIHKKGAEDGIHIANCGALWQMVVQGFAGIKPGYQNEQIEMIPRLPQFIEEIRLKFVWKGKRYHVLVNHKETVLEEQNT